MEQANAEESTALQSCALVNKQVTQARSQEKAAGDVDLINPVHANSDDVLRNRRAHWICSFRNRPCY